MTFVSGYELVTKLTPIENIEVDANPEETGSVLSATKTNYTKICYEG